MSAQAPTAAALAIPQTVARDVPVEGRLPGFCRRAEELGFEGLWTSELTTTEVLDPLPLLAYCAALTTRVELGVAVLLTALRSPLRLAQETATIDRLSAGRLIVGVGLGSNRALYGKHRLDPRRRAERFETGLNVLLGLWRGDAELAPDPFGEVDGSEPVPRPTRRPHPPLWFGARSEAGLRRAARLGNGFVGSGSEAIAVFAQQARLLRQLTAEEGRQMRIAKRLYLVVDDDADRARTVARTWFGRSYGNADLADRVAAVGTPADVADAASAVVDAGAELIIFNPIVDEVEQVERLVAEVLPAMPDDRRPALKPT